MRRISNKSRDNLQEVGMARKESEYINDARKVFNYSGIYKIVAC